MKSYPLLGNLDEYVRHLTGQAEFDYDHLFEIFAFTKSDHWAYEDEWRCVSHLNNRELGFDYEPFIPSELEAVYVGHRASEEHTKAALDVLREKYPDTQIFSSSINIQDYSISFQEYR